MLRMGWRLNCMRMQNPGSAKRFACGWNSAKITNTRHALYQDYKFFWITLKLLGMFPYKVQKSGQVKFNYFSIEMAYSLLVYCIISVPVVLVLRLRFIQHGAVGGNFNEEIFIYMLSVLMIPHLSIPMTHWYELRLFQFIFKRWREFQTVYEETFNEKLSLKPHWTTKLLLCVLFLTTAFAAACNFAMAGFQSCWEMFAHLHILHLFFLHNLILIGLCCRIRVIARDVRLRLVQAVKFEDGTMISRISSFWILLSEITRLVGSLFYRMYCYLFIAIFSVSTVLTYILLRAMANHRLHLSMLREYALLLSNTLWLFLICEYGERVANEAGNKFTLSLSKLRATVKNQDTKYEIDSFISMISSYPPYITLHEYIKVNRMCFVTINGTMVTYLIVVLQFSKEHSDPYLLPSSNMTGFALTTAIAM